jgi:hypothetical protein
VFCYFALLGTSDNATTTFTLPLAASESFTFMAITYDNGSTYQVGQVNVSSSTVTMYKGVGGVAFTASNAKYAYGEFWYITA